MKLILTIECPEACEVAAKMALLIKQMGDLEGVVLSASVDGKYTTATAPVALFGNLNTSE